MDFFSNSKPNLLASDLKNNYNSLFFNTNDITNSNIIGNTNNNNNYIENINNTLPQNNAPTTPIKDINKVFYDIYNSYIVDNFYLILVILGIILFLYYRYCNKKNMIDNFSDLDEPFIRPVFNPHYPVKKQVNYAVYPPGRLPLKINNDPDKINYIGDPKVYDNNIAFSNDAYKMMMIDQLNKNKRVINGQLYPQTFPNYGINQKKNTEYTGLYDSYKDDIYQAHQLQNPLGFKTNFNQVTGNVSKQMTQSNINNIQNYVDIINGTNETLEANLNKENINIDPDNYIEPPYAS